ncbi:MAG: DegT/DnrJ/EryC1/StrS family aminotransferase [Desulfobaccales bacterium]
MINGNHKNKGPNKFISISSPSITQKEIDFVKDAVESGWVSSLGKYIKIFEDKFAEFCGTKYALATSNGTAALHLAVALLGIKEGDEVIIPDLTFIATANAVSYTGARPVCADIEAETWCIDPKSIRKKITERTKAIIPVHLYGHPADMDGIMDLAKEYKLYVIEDASEAHGARYKNRMVGSIGDLGVFSFYGNKIMTTGEGGMITTNNPAFYEKAAFLRDHAMSKDKRYWHPEIGFNYRLTNLQAALGVAQLERIDELIDKKRRIFKWYEQSLKGLNGIKLNPQKDWAENVYWMICLLLEESISGKRESLMQKLKQKGIDSRPFFYPISLMPMYKSEEINQIAYSVSRRGLNLPSGVGLTRDEVQYIAQAIYEHIMP